MQGVKFIRHSTFDYRRVKICLVQNRFYRVQRQAKFSGNLRAGFSWISAVF